MSQGLGSRKMGHLPLQPALLAGNHAGRVSSWTAAKSRASAACCQMWSACSCPACTLSSSATSSWCGEVQGCWHLAARHCRLESQPCVDAFQHAGGRGCGESVGSHPFNGCSSIVAPLPCHMCARACVRVCACAHTCTHVHPHTPVPVLSSSSCRATAPLLVGLRPSWDWHLCPGVCAALEKHRCPCPVPANSAPCRLASAG